MNLTRRQATKLAFAGMALAVGGKNLVRAAAGQVTPTRIPLSTFLQDDKRLKALRKGVGAMKKRKTSDPLSWNFQAAIHGITDQMVNAFAKDDADVLNVDRAKYWNQCPHHGQNSANFLPWHRAYTHYFEEILRMHTEQDDFALPYWDYSAPDYLDFPREFGIEHLDGNVKNDDASNKNPLFCEQRDYFLCGYEHPYTDQLPLSQLSPRALDSTRALNSAVFFGTSESTGLGGGVYDTDPGTRGLLEQSPHDQIHRVVGGSVTGSDDDMKPTSASGFMAVPETAGFDPIFSVHHSNIDRLWAKWSCTPGKNWGTLPDANWFHEAPWFFFDVKGKEVNLPRKYYFDYRALGVRFSDEDLNATPLQLPDSIRLSAELMAMEATPSVRITSSVAIDAVRRIEAPARGATVIPLALPPQPVHGKKEAHGKRTQLSIMTLLGVDPSTETVWITLHNIDIRGVHATGFDVFLVEDGTSDSSLTPRSPGYLGPINLFVHAGVMEDGMGEGVDQTFDASSALTALKHKTLSGLHIVLVPYALATTPKVENVPFKFESGPLKASRISIMKASR